MPAAQRGAQAGLAVLRGGRLPADRLADGVPDALHPGRPQGRRHGARAGRRRRRRHRADRAGPRRRACGCCATSRDEAKRARALEIGAHEVFESGARLPVKVDAVMETVGRATWSHSIRALRPGGTIVISGTTSGPEARRRRADPDLLPPAAGHRLDDGHPRRARRRWSQLLDATGTRPLIDRTLPMDRGRATGFAAMADGRRLRQDRVHPMTGPPRSPAPARHRRGAVADAPAAPRRRAACCSARNARARPTSCARALPRRRRAWSPTWPTRRARGRAVARPARRARLRGPRRRRRRARPGRRPQPLDDLARAARRQPGRAGGADPRRCLPALRAARGTVVFVNSGAGLTAHPQLVGVRRVEVRPARRSPTRCAPRRREHGVRVTTVYPGRTATPMQEKVHEQEGKEYDPPRWIDPATVADAHPARRSTCRPTRRSPSVTVHGRALSSPWRRARE